MTSRIAIVNSMYSEGMGYFENCLPAALARLGHEVHVVTSTFNQYANEPMYDEAYGRFIGPRQVGPGSSDVDGYRLHRLEASLLAGYVRIHGLGRRVAELAPDVVYSCEIASLETFALALRKPIGHFKLFCGTHQTASVLKPFLRQEGASMQKTWYRLTRTLPASLASMTVERVFAQAPDCLEVAARFYGVPRRKLVLRPLGTDTVLFHPPRDPAEVAARRQLRAALDLAETDIVCLYSGRLTPDKNPLVLARAIDALHEIDPRFKGLFIGEGIQREAIASCRNTRVVPFMRYPELAAYYRAAEIGVWPRQESMSMLDAAATGLPVIVSNTMSDPARIDGNGRMYEEDSVPSLIEALRTFADAAARRQYGSVGRERMIEHFSWLRLARAFEADFFGLRVP